MSILHEHAHHQPQLCHSSAPLDTLPILQCVSPQGAPHLQQCHAQYLLLLHQAYHLRGQRRDEAAWDQEGGHVEQVNEHLVPEHDGKWCLNYTEY